VGGPRGPSDAPPYGARLRLRSDYPIERLPRGALVVARAMQRYGMLLADGGQITLTAQSDRLTTAKWSGCWVRATWRAQARGLRDGRRRPRIPVNYRVRNVLQARFDALLGLTELATPERLSATFTVSPVTRGRRQPQRQFFCVADMGSLARRLHPGS
jgi:hypothetical protein